MLNNHAPVVSNLKEGTIKIHIHSQSNIVVGELNEKLIPDETDDKILTLVIGYVTLELNDSKAIILAD